MAITLRVTSNHAQFMGEGAEVTFTGQCRVGRASHNDFVLSDPDRIVSNDHVTLMESDQQWSLHDTSTNGTTINDQTASRGAATLLKTGDVLGIGTYQVEVVVSPVLAGAAVPVPTISDPQIGQPLGPDLPADQNLFASQDPSADPDPFGGQNPFASQEPAGVQAPAAGQDLFDAPDPLAGQPAAGAFDSVQPAPGGLDPLAFDAMPLDPMPLDAMPLDPMPLGGAPDAASSLNPLDHFGEAGLDPLGLPDSAGGSEDPLFGGGIGQPQDAQRDDVPADQHMFEPPRMVPDANPPFGGGEPEGGVGGIPANWLDEDDTQPPVHSPPFAPAPSQPVAPQPGAAAFSPQALGQPAAPAMGGANELTALWQAAGLDPATVDPAAAESMGKILVVVVQGMMEVLRARAEIKNQFRVAMTMLKSADNNPLKLATTPQDALAKLFGPQGQGYQDPLTAFQEGFRDIRNHQVAMLYAMQSGFNAVQGRYDPDQLEQRFDRGLKRGSILGVVNKSKYWDLYRDMVEQLGDGDEAFRDLFGETFAIAYEEQLGRLNREQ